MIEQISVTDLKELHDTGTARMIDVREKWEFDAGHVPGAEWIPMSLVPLRKDEFAGDNPAYILCRTGNRSGQVVMWLARQGIESINVAGGTEMWQRQGFPIETGQPAERTR
ncbi:MAG: rhodanese-like domain-containing protein [Candidatus Nanopelagicales bacterium]